MAEQKEEEPPGLAELLELDPYLSDFKADFCLRYVAAWHFVFEAWLKQFSLVEDTDAFLIGSGG